MGCLSHLLPAGAAAAIDHGCGGGTIQRTGGVQRNILLCGLLVMNMVIASAITAKRGRDTSLHHYFSASHPPIADPAKTNTVTPHGRRGRTCNLARPAVSSNTTRSECIERYQPAIRRVYLFICSALSTYVLLCTLQPCTASLPVWKRWPPPALALISASGFGTRPPGA